MKKKNPNSHLARFRNNKQAQVAAMLLLVVLLCIGGWVAARPDGMPVSNSTNLTSDESINDEDTPEEEQAGEQTEESPEVAVTGPKENQSAAAPDPCPKANIEGDRCVITFDAPRVPARFEGMDEANMSLYGAATDFIAICHTADACEKMEGSPGAGTKVSQETVSRIDWKIVAPTKITVKVKLKNPPYEYTGYRYQDEGGQPVCTGNHWYCYVIRADYKKNQ